MIKVSNEMNVPTIMDSQVDGNAVNGLIRNFGAMIESLKSEGYNAKEINAFMEKTVVELLDVQTSYLFEDGE